MSKNNLTKGTKSLKVAMIAPPWLKIPVVGYGGVENVIEALVLELEKRDIEVHLFTVKGSKLGKAKIHEITAKEEYDNILKPMYDFSLPAPTAHLLKSIEKIREIGDFDIIHDHNYFLGPALLSQIAGKNGVPPAVHTVHGPPLTPKAQVAEGVTDNRIFWKAIAGDHHCSLISISNSMRDEMPEELKNTPVLASTVYNAVDINDFPFKSRKKNYFLTLGGISPEKNQGLAAKITVKQNKRLRIAGPIVDIKTYQKLFKELANPVSKYYKNRNFLYFTKHVLPYILASPLTTYSGMLSGKAKMKALANAKALLHPIEWNEPFGMVIIEALACGTPVVAMNRGAMSEIIEHGVNGFLAENEKEFAEYMKRVDEIDPQTCRQSVIDKFSSSAMADGYIKAYKNAIKRAK